MKRVTATQARADLSELIRQVMEDGGPIVIERDGKPQVVVLSVDRYEQLLAREKGPESWSGLVDRARIRVQAELGDRDLPPPEEVLRQDREERETYLLE